MTDKTSVVQKQELVQYKADDKTFRITKSEGGNYSVLEDVIRWCGGNLSITPKLLEFSAGKAGAILNELNEIIPDHCFYGNGITWDKESSGRVARELKAIRDSLYRQVFNIMGDASESNTKTFTRNQCSFMNDVIKLLNNRITELSRDACNGDEGAAAKRAIFQKIYGLCSKLKFTLKDFVAILSAINPAGKSQDNKTLNTHRNEGQTGDTKSMRVLKIIFDTFENGILAHKDLIQEVFGTNNNTKVAVDSVSLKLNSTQ